MASKRNSRVNDDGKRREEGQQKPATTSYRPRVNSRGSIKDHLLQLAEEMEEGQRNGILPREATAATRSQSITGGAREVAALGTSGNRIGEKTGEQPTSSQAVFSPEQCH